MVKVLRLSVLSVGSLLFSLPSLAATTKFTACSFPLQDKKVITGAMGYMHNTSEKADGKPRSFMRVEKNLAQRGFTVYRQKVTIGEKPTDFTVVTDFRQPLVNGKSKLVQVTFYGYVTFFRAEWQRGRPVG